MTEINDFEILKLITDLKQSRFHSKESALDEIKMFIINSAQGRK